MVSKNISSLQLFQLFRFGAAILIGILLVQMGMPLEEVGIFEAFLFLGNIFSFFWTMGIKNSLLSFFPNLKQEKESIYFNVYILLLLFSLIAGLIFYLFQDWILVLTGFGEFSYSGMIVIYLCLAASTILIEVILVLQNQSREILSYGLSIHLLQVILVSAAFGVTGSLEYVLLAFIVFAFIKHLYLIFLVRRFSIFKLNTGLIIGFMTVSFPLILHALLGNGMEFVDGIIVGNHFSPGEFAVFRYGAREFPLVTIMEGALVMALIPMAKNQLEEARLEIVKRTNQMIFVLFPIAIILMLLSPILFPIIYSADYAMSARIFNIYLLIIVTRVLTPQIFLLAFQKNYQILVISIIELIINVTLSLIWVRTLGLVGIAYATLVAYLIQKVILIIYTQKTLGLNLKSYVDVPKYIIASGILIGAFFVSYLY